MKKEWFCIVHVWSYLARIVETLIFKELLWWTAPLQWLLASCLVKHPCDYIGRHTYLERLWMESCMKQKHIWNKLLLIILMLYRRLVMSSFFCLSYFNKQLTKKIANVGSQIFDWWQLVNSLVSICFESVTCLLAFHWLFVYLLLVLILLVNWWSKLHQISVASNLKFFF